MAFTEFNDSNNEINSFLHKTIFGENSIFINDNIFSESFITVSGSSILQIYNTYILKNNNNINVNDIDIYIQPSKQYKRKIENILFKLVSSGYQFNLYKNNISAAYDSLKLKLEKMILQKESECIDNNIKYFSLSKYIYTVITFYNPFINKNIDVIFIRCNIRKLLIKTFDFDIIKNYYNNEKIYIYNVNSILNKTAVMTENHLRNRVFYNLTELYNFTKRHEKYHNRGYNIYIEGNAIPNCFIVKIIILLNKLYNIKCCCRRHTHLYSLKFKILNCSDYLLDFYYKTFYLNEELMRKVYHPNNVFNISNEYLLDNE